MSALMVGSAEIGSTMHGHNDLQQHVDSSAVYGQYVNSSLSPITVTVTLRSITGGGTGNGAFYQPPNVKTCWFHIEEAQRLKELSIKRTRQCEGICT